MLDFLPSGSSLTILVLGFLALILINKSIQIVPQSKQYTVERFGRYTYTLKPGLSFIVPIMDRISHKVVILERQLDPFKISVITRDNVEIDLIATVFFQIKDPYKAMYEIAHVQSALETTATSTIRSAVGKLELDEVQSSRQQMNEEIQKRVTDACKDWGVIISRTEITDVRVDDKTKAAQRLQLNAEREKRAIVTKAEGERQAIQLNADGQLYEAQKIAEAVKISADAKAYSIQVEAKANADQIDLIAQAVAKNGQPAVDFEIRKRQVSAISELAASKTTKTLVLPAEVAGVLGSLDSLTRLIAGARDETSRPGGV